VTRPADGDERRAWTEDVIENRAALYLDGHDSDIAGVLLGNLSLVVYDFDAVLETLMQRDGMDMTGAREWFSYNILGSSTEPDSPVYLVTVPAIDDIPAPDDGDDR
jgi:hypothetical protein